jgi:hypothetical protein
MWGSLAKQSSCTPLHPSSLRPEEKYAGHPSYPEISLNGGAFAFPRQLFFFPFLFSAALRLGLALLGLVQYSKYSTVRDYFTMSRHAGRVAIGRGYGDCPVQ